METPENNLPPKNHDQINPDLKPDISDGLSENNPDLDPIKVQAWTDFFTNAEISVPLSDGSFEIVNFQEAELERTVKFFVKNGSQTIPDFTEKFITNIQNFEITPEQWKKACLSQPSLFYQSPQTLHDNIQTTAKLMGISKEQTVGAALKVPSLFSASPYTLEDKFWIACNHLCQRNLQEAQNLALKSPNILGYSQERLLTTALARDITQLKIDITKNPEKELEKQFVKRGWDMIGWKMLSGAIRHLKEWEREAKKERLANAKAQAEKLAQLRSQNDRDTPHPHQE